MRKVSLCIESGLKDGDFYEKIRVEVKSGFNAIELWGSKFYFLKKTQTIIKQNNAPINPCSLMDIGCIGCF